MIFGPNSIKLTFVQAGGGILHQDGWVHRKAVPYIIVAQAVEGAYEIEVDGASSVRLEQGEAFLTAPDVPLVITHHCNPQSGMMRMRWVHFNFSVFDALGLASLVKFPVRMEADWADRIGQLSEKILTLQDLDLKKSLNSEVKINTFAFESLSILLDFLESKDLRPEFRPGIERLFPALEYARRNLTDRIEVADLARKVGLSVPRFHVEFKRHFGETPIEHLRKLRLSKACDLLRGSDRTLEEIAMETGFCSQFHFSREFRRFYGEPPSVYRQTMRRDFAL